MISAFARRLVLPGLFSLAGFAFLISLGVWQLHRKEWKEGLIATLDQQLKAEPSPLPPPAQWPSLTADNSEFRRVKFTAAYKNEDDVLLYTGKSALRADIREPGYFIFAPVTLPDGRRVVVNRGYLATDSYPGRAGTEEITGYIRFPEQPSLLRDLFTDQSTSRRIWTLRDPLAMARAKNWGEVAPFYIDQEGPVPGPGLPKPGPLSIKLRNDHLGYALTWFGLAAALVAVFAAWATREWYLMTSEPPPASL